MGAYGCIRMTIGCIRMHMGSLYSLSGLCIVCRGFVLSVGALYGLLGLRIVGWSFEKCLWALYLITKTTYSNRKINLIDLNEWVI